MVNTVRAKFQVVSKDPGETGKVRLFPVYGDSEENKTFWDATPAGTIELYITNPAAFGFFSAGAEVYVDFTKAE